ncbi:MAG: DUF4426 domain-containing protein [Pseudomonadota bacterium]
MKSQRHLITLTLLFTLAACGGGSGGETDVPPAQPAGATNAAIGDHVIHFSAISTDGLPREVAQAYDIVRSKNRAMLNLSIVTADGGMPVPASIDVKTVNLTGQAKTITMRQIDEQDAIYYIGVLPVANRETLIFEIGVRPDGDTRTHQVRFQRQFYTD